MQYELGAHISEEALERYAMGTLPEAELAPVEEHLLVCHGCQDRLAETEGFIRAMRAAARKLQAAPPSRLRAALEAGFSFPSRVWMPAVAVLAIVVGLAGWWTLTRKPGTPAVAVALHSVRGAEGLAGGARAPSGRALLLRMDLAGTPEAGSYELEVVNAQGQAVQQSTVRRTGDRADITLSRLEPGQYWVRLYRPGSRRELAREFGLRVE